MLAEGIDVNAHDEKMIGETALCLAVQQGHAAMVALLLEHGADPDIKGWVGLSARMRAQRRSDDVGRKIAALIERRRPTNP